MKSRALVTVAAVLAALTLTACSGSGSNSGTKATAATGQNQVAAPAENGSGSSAIKPGAEKMRQKVAELKAAVESGDAAKAKELAAETDEAWEQFEDAVKEKDKALYGQVEEPLHAIVAGVKVSPLDKTVLGEQIAKLDALLVQLAK